MESWKWDMKKFCYFTFVRWKNPKVQRTKENVNLLLCLSKESPHTQKVDFQHEIIVDKITKCGKETSCFLRWEGRNDYSFSTLKTGLTGDVLKKTVKEWNQTHKTFWEIQNSSPLLLSPPFRKNLFSLLLLLLKIPRTLHTFYQKNRTATKLCGPQILQKVKK